MDCPPAWAGQMRRQQGALLGLDIGLLVQREGNSIGILHRVRDNEGEATEVLTRLP